MAWGTNDSKSCESLLNRIEKNDPLLTELVVLPMKSFGDAELNRLSEILTSGMNTHLVNISASGHRVSNSSLNKFAKAIASPGGKCIKFVSIGDDNMGDDGIQAFCDGLVQVYGGFLEGLDFSSKRLTSVAMKYLGETFGKSNFLKELKLYRNPIGDEGLTNFVSAAMSCGDKIALPSLQHLDLAECDVGSAGIRSLVTCFESVSGEYAQMELILNNNPKIGPEGCFFIKKLISTTNSHASRVKKLCIRLCDIGDTGILNLGEAFKCGECKGFCHLDLAGNNVGPDGFSRFASILQLHRDRIKDLKFLNLADNDLGHDGVFALTQSLQKNTIDDGNSSINRIDLSNTNCGHEAAALLLRCTSLESLRLFNNNLRDGLDSLTYYLTGGHSKLLHLDLSGNGASGTTISSLLSAISILHEPDKSVLELLELGGNEINEEAIELIKELKKTRPSLDIAHDRPNTNN